MEPTDHNQTTFDVIPLGDYWEVRGPRRRAICSTANQKHALEFAWITAMEHPPAKVRLMTTNRLVKQEWDYPA